ncbi:hypothetical protein LWC34_40475 [Kibdelosporangium philippinense]|uniref:Uncharacterized protein n=1 Tax=Kibdelosporangium philippinense TaxID=211113 RepID=A0ABS8ZMN7_9PSEU|nr:hypothetical protein [Kibdelosporangium philippinense]MCE7009045.1 hypothetical protein [Kibdelosporangium philippinense]
MGKGMCRDEYAMPTPHDRQAPKPDSPAHTRVLNAEQPRNLSDGQQA